MLLPFAAIVRGQGSFVSTLPGRAVVVAGADAVAAPDFTMSIASPPATLNVGSDVVLTTIVAAEGTFNAPVKLSIEPGVPSFLQLTFSADTITPDQARPTWTPTFASYLDVHVSPIPATVTAAGYSMRAGGAAAVLGLLVLLPLFRVRRFRLRSSRAWQGLLALVALGALATLQGCGQGRYPPDVPPGVYPVVIDGTAATGQTHSLQLMLRVAQ